MKVIHFVPYYPPERTGGVGEVVAGLHQALGEVPVRQLEGVGGQGDASEAQLPGSGDDVEDLGVGRGLAAQQPDADGPLAAGPAQLLVGALQREPAAGLPGCGGVQAERAAVVAAAARFSSRLRLLMAGAPPGAAPAGEHGPAPGPTSGRADAGPAAGRRRPAGLPAARNPASSGNTAGLGRRQPLTPATDSTGSSGKIGSR